MMTREEIDAFVALYQEKYKWQLVARSGNGDKTDDSYLYHFVDDINIGITINPSNKGFKFSKTVDWVFNLQSGELTPLDYQDHFERNYLRFRKIILEKNLD